MTRIDSTQIKWRVETKAKTGRWVKRGLYETRSAARMAARVLRNGLEVKGVQHFDGYGFGRVRVVRHISGKGKV
jgi:hypothetical protein